MLRSTVEPLGADEPAVATVDALLARAIEAGASDVHIAPSSLGGSIRIRVEGTLLPAGLISAESLLRVVSRIKLLAGMDIADRRLPQDGRYDVEHHGRRIDLRVSSIPTIDGERLSIRLLDRDAQARWIDRLGMPPAVLSSFRRTVCSEAGFVVICGPTGGGKTTTLYAAVRERQVESEHVCSVEDPVELRVAGIAQVQVNVRAGLTFPTVLRALLRQDPDVVAIGEMRDAETAHIAMTAALCGRLVLTTLHAGNAVIAFERLRELGIAPRTLASAVTAVLAQRLVRGLGGVAGSGRTAMFELLTVSDELRQALQAGASMRAIATIAIENGYRPFSDRAA